jgi:hypothetical protein
MKKALALLMIFALVASVAFAEVSIGAWGRGIFLPVNHNGDDSITDTAPSWGGWAGDESRIGFTIAGNSDNVGFVIDGNVDGGAFSMGDNQYIWVKPVDMLTLRMGNLYDDTLRGNAAFGSFNWYRPLGNGDGEDITFSRVGMNRSREGFEVALAPMDALYVALYFYNLDKNLTENLFSNMQFAVGYTIDGIGQIKGQILTTAKMEDPTYALPANPDDYTYGWVDHDGDPSTESVWGPEAVATSSGKVDETGAKIELAFNLTMVENLFVEIGFGMETNNKVDTSEAKDINLYAKYNMDALTIHFLSMNSVYKDAADDSKISYKVALGADYDIGDGIGVAADFTFGDNTEDNTDPVVTGFAGVTKGFSNGKIGAGVQVLNDGEDTHFGIPVVMEYWF